MSYEHYEFLHVATHDGIATVTLNRPAARNAIEAQGHRELERIWDDLASDAEVRVIVLTGAGTSFSSGGDLKAMVEGFGTPAFRQQMLGIPGAARRLLRRMLDVPQPILAAINGDAIGLGATLALVCDVSVMSEDARIGDTHVKLGLVAGDGGTIIWPLLIGPNRAKEMLMRGRLASATECRQWGLVNHVVPAADVGPLTESIARELAALAPWAVQWTKHSVNAAIRQQLNLQLDAALGFEALTMQSADHLEAAQALLERRPPKFEGR